MIIARRILDIKGVKAPKMMIYRSKIVPARNDFKLRRLHQLVGSLNLTPGPFPMWEGEMISYTRLMSLQKSSPDPLISSSDSNEYFNSISHLIGAILSISALAVLVTLAAIDHKPVHVISFAIYGTSLFLSFLFSSLLHFFLLFKKYMRSSAFSTIMPFTCSLQAHTLHFV